MLDLKELYKQKVAPALLREFNYTNPMMVPKITKVVVNRGLGKIATENAKNVDIFVDELQQITGQKAVVTKSKKSISNFKLRENLAIGCKVTLRKNKMYDFLAKLLNLALPKVRDFRGVPRNSFDGRGNYSLGIQEQIIFPEIRFEQVQKLTGMDITICTTARTNKEAYFLLEKMGMPFRK
ncbi:50S ribosomal protein L5 [Candidatus Termititenax persephonae]|uniref:Large ribosomal subunit protein uL5 n=1 Tax=Candidatus Termititenax persephonae TaxID=2218525 RepID=A0A388TFI6_9BACT|nr:50S ribosomal protein L5 [Candidatus Termititenax persephonae]